MVTIELDDHFALVLFAFLTREIDDRDSKHIASVIEHPAEFWSLNAVLGALEENLIEPLEANYLDLVAAARERVMQHSDPDGSWDYGPIVRDA